MTNVNRIPPAFRPFKKTRQGSTYFVVVAVTSVATIVAFSAFAISTTHRKNSELETRFTQANLSLRSGLDIAIHSLQSEPGWRSKYRQNNSEATAISTTLDDCNIQWYLKDPIDNDISNQTGQPVKIFAVGKSGNCRRSISALAFPTGKALDVLRAPLHATGNIELAAPVVIAKGPLSADKKIKGQGNSIFGDIESRSQSDIANVYHSTFKLSGPKAFPSKLVFSAYESFATKVDFRSLAIPNRIQNQLISDTSAPSPTTHANLNAVYQVEVPPATTLTISNTVITGTLLVKLSGGRSKLKIGEGVIWHPLLKGYPSLLVYCDQDRKNTVEIQCKGKCRHPLTGSENEASL
ncbi:MAG: hypothetical protein VX438_07145, partial [Planctomycetota bacterium]|nr:hypothetical protein [Planctomycetota bacterium]